MYFPYTHKSWQRVTLASQLFQFLLAFRWSGSCYKFQVYAANCKQAELLHITKIKEYQICCHQVCSMSQTPNMWNICNRRGEEGKGWRGSEEQGGANLLLGFRGIRPCLTAVNRQSLFLRFGVTRNTNYTLGGLLYIFCKFSVSIVNASLSKIMKIG